MKRYAFIDVQNTASTTQNHLGFIIDWKKLVDYLKNNRSCSEILFYTGIENGDTETADEFEELSKIQGCTVRSKSVFAYKNKDKAIPFKCTGCGHEDVQVVNMGYRKKSNCDVELSVDVIEKSDNETEFYIFTGDGDFEYLIRKALSKGVQSVHIYAYANPKKKAGVKISSYSTKLKELVTEDPNRVYYVSLKDIKDRIKKDIQT